MWGWCSQFQSTSLSPFKESSYFQIFAPCISIVSDAATNDKYVNYTIPDLHNYSTAVGTEVMQVIVWLSN